MCAIAVIEVCGEIEHFWSSAVFPTQTSEKFVF